MGRHPKPVTISAAELSDCHGRTCLNTGRQVTHLLCRFLIDASRHARSTPESRRHGRRPWIPRWDRAAASPLPPAPKFGVVLRTVPRNFDHQLAHMEDEMPTRREFLLTTVGATALAACQVKIARSAGNTFQLWAFSDTHVATDDRNGRKSLAEAISQSEIGGKEGGPPFDWDIAINAGDMSGAQGLPLDEEGEEIVRQFRTLTKHKREDIYDICGNHDRSGLSQPDAWWFQKWLDPLGQHTEFSGVNPAKRPYPIDGTWERYSFRVGNILFLMMSDRNEPSQKIGRGTLGGHPGGVVSGETFAWWKKMVEANPDSIIISVHHYVLKNTTVASGEWEGMSKDDNGKWIGHYHVTLNRAHRKELLISIGSTASRMRKPSKNISIRIGVLFKCG